MRTGKGHLNLFFDRLEGSFPFSIFNFQVFHSHATIAHMFFVMLCGIVLGDVCRNIYTHTTYCVGVVLLDRREEGLTPG